MKKIVYYVIAATIIVMATSCGGSTSSKEELDSLKTALEQRNADYNELNDSRRIWMLISRR